MRTLPLAVGLLGLWTLTTAGMCVSDRPPQVVTQEVRVPVPVPCDPKTGQRPDFPDTDAALRAAPTDEMLKLLYAGRKLRSAWIGTLEAGLNGCKTAPDG